MSTSGAKALPSQLVVNLNVAVSASVNLNIRQGPEDPAPSAASGHTAALFTLGSVARIVLLPPLAGRRPLMSGAVCQSVAEAQKSPVWVKDVAPLSVTVVPGKYVRAMSLNDGAPGSLKGTSTFNWSAVWATTIPAWPPPKVTPVDDVNLSTAVEEIVSVSPPA